MSDPFAQTLYAPSSPSPADAPVSSGITPSDITPSGVTPSGIRPSEVPPTGPSVSETRVRRVAGRYEIVGLLGAGGMGNVYRARDLELGETVALKMLRPEIVTNPAALDRFRLEVKLARRVTHPNVARVFDIGEDGGEKFLTMELIDGEALSTEIRREGRLPAARAAAIARAVCEGLSAAHAAGVVHRDLKPDNVLLARDGRTVVTDFGIAQAAGMDQARVTASVVGTPEYMSPEQVEGKQADARADLYALGVMLYEMVTGEPPWTGDSVFAVAAARLLGPPPDPLARQPHLPRELAIAIRTLMARAPEERYPSAAAARDALASVPAVVSGAVAPTVNLARPALCKCKKQIAVLPLRNAGPKEDAYIADGLTEDLIDLLSMASGVRVRSRGMVAKYCCGDRDPREVGRELDVQVVVDGTVRRTPAGVRVTVRLVSVVDGVQIWHKRFDRKPEDLLSVSDDAARSIAEALAVQLDAPERGTSNPEAIELYLRARALYARFFEDRSGEAMQLLERARALAPDDPRILAGYAMAAARRWARDSSAAATAREAAQAAVARAPNLAESHVALAVVRYREQREPDAVRALKRALIASPTSAEAHDLLGRILVETRLLAEARAHLDAALLAEPEMHLSRVALVKLCGLRGAMDEARALVLAGSDSPASLPALSRYCLWRRDVELARATLEDPAMQSADWRFVRFLLRLVADGTPPWDDLDALTSKSDRLTPFTCQIIAECAMYLGETERALAAVEAADGVNLFDLTWMDMCPLLDALRGHPRFRAVRERVEARASAIEMAYQEAMASPARPWAPSGVPAES